MYPENRKEEEKEDEILEDIFLAVNRLRHLRDQRKKRIDEIIRNEKGPHEKRCGII